MNLKKMMTKLSVTVLSVLVLAQFVISDTAYADEETQNTVDVAAVPVVGTPVPEVVAPVLQVDAAAVPATTTQTSNGLVLVYLNGTDLESNGGAATRLVNQAINASASGNTRFVIVAGGTKKWQK